MREQIIQQILEHKLIVIVRGVYGEDCVKLAEALYEGGIRMMEITFDHSKPELLHRTSDTIQAVKQYMGEKMAVGAGTVTTLETLELAKNAGAQFIISPDTNEAVIRKTLEGKMVSIPAAMTATEVLTAYSYGADFVKMFPIGNLGAGYLKAICAPINYVPLLAVGGVNEKNIGEFLNAGAVGAGVGGNLVNKEWIKAGEFDKITALARKFLENIQ